ncbi:13048_t:CDS:2 [Ambispora gerdemannii]|uniref:13048_t:CDS:1 n=1 Tax=Ambispora gerdemannii TaxID=144530 RepID=A0A9N8UYM8_9GLOM|nr:13048_t:CDS:2 [Ambispora gerdemannii]
MSTLLINSSCEEVFGGSSSNSVSQLVNVHFSNRNISSSLSNNREHQEDIKFRIKHQEHFSAAAWESFSKKWDNDNNINVNISDEEYRQEWGDEHLTDVFIKNHGLHQFFYDFSTSFHGQDSGINGVNRNTSSYQNGSGNLVEEFQQFNIMNDVYHSSDYTAAATTTTFQTNHNDLHQACIYLLDHLISLVSQSSTHQSTRRPCPEAEWDWQNNGWNC